MRTDQCRGGQRSAVSQGARDMKRNISCPLQKVQQIPGCPIPPGFHVRLGGVNEPPAAILKESRTRCHGWGRAVGNPRSFAFFAKGGIPRISIPTVVYPTLCKERKGWGTRLFVVLPAVPNTKGGLIQDLFLLREPHAGEKSRAMVEAEPFPSPKLPLAACTWRHGSFQLCPRPRAFGTNNLCSHK